MRFRGKALAELSAPERLDESVRLATVPAWLVAAALAVAVGSAAVWSFTGSVPRTVTGPGVLTHAAGVSTLEATVGGQVTEVWVSPDSRIAAGDLIFSAIADDGTTVTERAPWPAVVVNLGVTDGMLMRPGDTVAALERLDTPGDALLARVYVPADRAPMLRPGLPVDIEVASVPAAVFGTLAGTVSDVGQFPETEASLRAFHGTDTDVRGFLGAGAPVAVTVALDPDPAGAGGLAWSKVGPPYSVPSQSEVTADIVVAAERPVDWLVNRS